MLTFTRREVAERLSLGALAQIVGGRSARGATSLGRHVTRSHDLAFFRTRLGPVADIEGLDQPSRLADLGYLRVPADWTARSGADVMLRFARFPGSGGSSEPPVFWFAGGPFRTNDLYGFVEAPGDLRQAKRALGIIDTIVAHRDLVLMDHRGASGCAYPKLVPLGVHPDLPLDRPVSSAERSERYRDVNAEVIRRWHRAGVDLHFFNTPSLAKDVDAVREALGYDRIVLAGVSNGTYRCREYLRQFSARVDAAVLFTSHGYAKMPWPSDVAAALGRISRDVAIDPSIGHAIPHLETLLDEVSSRIARENPRVTVASPLDGERRTVCLGIEDFASFVWDMLASDADLLSGPAQLFKLKEGNYEALAKAAISTRFSGDAVYDSSAYELAFGGASLPDDYRERRAAAGIRPYLNRELQDGIQTGWPLARDDQRPFRHTVPTTYVQGEWDMRTPIEGLRSVLDDRSTLLTVPFSGHYADLETMIRPVMTAALAGASMPALHRRDRPAFLPIGRAD